MTRLALLREEDLTDGAVFLAVVRPFVLFLFGLALPRRFRVRVMVPVVARVSLAAFRLLRERVTEVLAHLEQKVGPGRQQERHAVEDQEREA